MRVPIVDATETGVRQTVWTAGELPPLDLAEVASGPIHRGVYGVDQ